MSQGVDYSRGGLPGSESLTAAGKAFVVRYVVGDLSPQGRGIRASEYAELTAGGIEVAAVWEGRENRITAGREAGKTDARDAVSHLANAGMPDRTPVYFACDFDAAPSDQAAIDEYLRGCADVMGADRVGIYGGFYVIKRCVENGTAQWFWQTSAWSGRQLHPAVHLYQHSYNLWINGVNCDGNTAYAENYGQASKFIAPLPPPPPTYPSADLPDWWDVQLQDAVPEVLDFKGTRWYPLRAKVRVVANRGTQVYTEPTTASPKAGPKITVRQPFMAERIGEVAHTDAVTGKTVKRSWLIGRDGFYVPERAVTPHYTARGR